MAPELKFGCHPQSTGRDLKSDDIKVIIEEYASDF
jgi:hypothetical protein